ncbi:uncharacterized protein LOC114276886 [Camellia sinensis]|uniref:uncharacterized protein LOC114276886 n=1 Tax=Camellia sinensis TaxID=4442 RepID=UPI001035582E|nr:uncharacterized protein LOC114276886 [Camellia sinensis]
MKVADEKACEDRQAQKEEEEEEEKEKDEGNDTIATETKSPTLNDHVIDLTEEDEDEVSKSTSPQKADTFEAKIAATSKSLEESLKEIDEEIAADIETEKATALSTQANTSPAAEVE